MKNRHPPAEDELVQTALHVVYWNQGPPRLRGVPVTPVAGVRHREPRGWAIDPRMIGPEPGHYEIWWLERVTVRELRLLLDVDEIGEGRDHCVLSAFDERDFQRVAGVEETSVLPYLTGTSEPSLDRAWLRFLLPRAVQTRALRLSCAGQDSIALRRFEAYADSR